MRQHYPEIQYEVAKHLGIEAAYVTQRQVLEFKKNQDEQQKRKSAISERKYKLAQKLAKLTGRSEVDCLSQATAIILKELKKENANITQTVPARHA